MCIRDSWEARQAFCARGDALSFTILRNPWERTVSAYLGKVASGTIAPDHDRSHTLSFAQFVQWLSSHGDREEDGSEINIHFMSWCAFAWPCTVLATNASGPHPDSALHTGRTDVARSRTVIRCSALRRPWTMTLPLS